MRLEKVKIHVQIPQKSKSEIMNFIFLTYPQRSVLYCSQKNRKRELGNGRKSPSLPTV